jgi:carboxyl-terminal processing protease
MLARLIRVLGSLVLVLGLCTVAYELGARRANPVALPPSFEPLEQVYDELSGRAVEPAADEALVEGAIEGMLGALDDEYAEYYDAEEFAALNSELNGRFVGIGVVLEDTELGLTVQTVLPGSPAEGAGLQPGDQIVAVDGRDVTGTPSEVVVDQVRGEEGSSVHLTVLRGDEPLREVDVVRAELTIPNVESRQLADGVGYVRLTQFTSDAGTLVRAEVEQLLAGGARGLVLDLRGNPGGYLPAAVAVAGVFVADEEVVRVGSAGDTVQRYRTEEQAPAGDVPLAVLVDGGSASASEIVAAALQDLHRAEIVGTTTFGKGTVQTIAHLDGERGLKFTTARYYTPSGDSIDGVGVAPDRLVQAGEGEPDQQLAAAQEALAAVLAGPA